MSEKEKIRLTQTKAGKKKTSELNRASSVRRESLASMTRSRMEQLVQTRRERGRLEAKYDAKHPRVQQLDRQMAAEHRAMVQARIEQHKASIKKPTRIGDRFILCGHVRDEDGYPIKGYQVGLYRQASSRAKAILTEYSDENGAFKMSIPVATASATKQKSQAHQFRLAVRNVAGKPVYKDNAPVKAVAGAFIHRSVMVPEVSQTRCGGSLTRFLGNSNSREVHDLDNEQKQCQLNKMKPDHRVYFSTLKQAGQADYDCCAYCFGSEKSKR